MTPSICGIPLIDAALNLSTNRCAHACLRDTLYHAAKPNIQHQNLLLVVTGLKTECLFKEVISVIYLCAHHNKYFLFGASASAGFKCAFKEVLRCENRVPTRRTIVCKQHDSIVTVNSARCALSRSAMYPTQRYRKLEFSVQESVMFDTFEFGARQKP